jgi:cycloartenol synthase
MSSSFSSSDDECHWKFNFAAQTWYFQPTEHPAPWPKFINPNSSDLVLRAQIACCPSPPPDKHNTLASAATKGALFYAALAQHQGCVPNDYGGPLFLLPGLVIALYITCKGQVLDGPHRLAMIRYICNHQQQDGGWGTHVAGKSTNFGATLNYTALRLLGVPSSHCACVRGREFLSERGGALNSPLWAKAWLACLGACSWEGIGPVPPEMWMLPTWFPFHPGKTWCHARMVALPMSYLYGTKFVYPQAETDPVVQSLRSELYTTANSVMYDKINWPSTRDMLDPKDSYGAKQSLILKFGNAVLSNLYEPVAGWLPLRKQSLEETVNQLIAEDEDTQYICIGPVNKAFNLLCAFARNDQQAVSKHLATVSKYLWVAEDGMKMKGYLNSMVWDASFSVLAVDELLRGCGGEMSALAQTELNKYADEARDFLLRNQVNSNPFQTSKFYRDHTFGGWGFSTKENTYIVSDCTAEALRAVLTSSNAASMEPSNAALDVILAMQNADDGGWASYEKRRGHAWYELLNPALVFGDIMIDYSYVECTSSCMQALASYVRKYHATERRRCQIALEAMDRALGFITNAQREDGSWLGKWGVCFTYGTWFACEALTACVEMDLANQDAKQAVERACFFLLTKQNDDGGWGESAESCVEKRYIRQPSTVVHTAWAVLTLCLATNKSLFAASIDKACALLAQRQTSCGDWPLQEGMFGVFNQTCGVTYTAYRNVFPTWALARARSGVLKYY